MYMIHLHAATVGIIVLYLLLKYNKLLCGDISAECDWYPLPHDAGGKGIPPGKTKTCDITRHQITDGCTNYCNVTVTFPLFSRFSLQPG